MIRNVSLLFGENPSPGVEWIHRTSRINNCEFDVIPPLEEITIRLSADELDALTIEETDGIIIVSHIVNGERQVVYSAAVQQP